MNSSQPESLSPQYFEALYRDNPDPWRFETSAYEAEKYATTIAALPKPRYHSGLEIGGSIGILTSLLAQRCDTLLSVDVSELAQQQAIDRCHSLPQVRFELMQVPNDYPERNFDLTILSEVGYYWCLEDLHKAQQLMVNHLEPGGHLLLVHWTPYDSNYHNPLSGDQVHDSFLELTPAKLLHLKGHRAKQYRLDLFERV